jgi:lipopolysaccharide heptosyltransferase I
MLERSVSKPRYLVIRLSSIGDIVHALPSVAALGESFPEAEIHWIVEKRHAALLEGNPCVGRVIQIDTLSRRGSLAAVSTVGEMWRTLRGLNEAGYEAAVDFQGLWKSALIARLSGARRKVGFARSWMREPGAGIFYSERVSPENRRHVIEMNLALVEHLGARPGRWQFPLPHASEAAQSVGRQLARIEAGDFIIVNPGGGWKAKRWAPENYARLLRYLESSFSGKILLTGSPQESAMISEILAGAETRRTFYFPSNLMEFIALARRARLFLGGDTGPLHLAAAVGTPVVAIYGPTDPVRNGPFSKSDIVLSNHAPVSYSRRHPNAAYIQGILVESVMAAIEERLARVNE